MTSTKPQQREDVPLPLRRTARFVVLLRGVNVGRGNRVPMAGFRQLLEGLGYTDVSTLLVSGNAVVSSTGRSPAAHARTIAAAVHEEFGISTPVIVKSTAEFRAIVTGNPMVPPATDHSRFLVACGQDAGALESLRPLLSLVQEPDRLVITAAAAYLHCPRGLHESQVGEAILGKAGKSVTTRNWATVLKIGARLSGA